MRKDNIIGYRPTWAEVNLGNLAYNIRQVRKLLQPRTKILVTIKADAYGHGLIPVAKKLMACGVDYFGVASIDEGMALRREGVDIPILVMGLILPEHVDPLFKYQLTPTVCSEEMAQVLQRKAQRLRTFINVHVKVDTGMARIGIKHEEALPLLRRIMQMRRVHVEGIFTHFAFADMNKEFTLYQIGLFEGLLQELRREGISIPLVHAANSMGVVEYRQGHFNMVRPGLVVYGLYPKEKVSISLKPVLSLKTKVVFVKQVPAGQGISYGHTYVAPRKTTIVTLPIGYGDGYPRNLSNSAPVLIRGKRFKVSGRICMDQIMVDVGAEKVQVGDEVVLIGIQGEERISTEELADLSGTIPYEIVCGIGSRVPRVYFENPTRFAKHFKQFNPELDYGKDLIR